MLIDGGVEIGLGPGAGFAQRVGAIIALLCVGQRGLVLVEIGLSQAWPFDAGSGIRSASRNPAAGKDLAGSSSWSSIAWCNN